MSEISATSPQSPEIRTASRDEMNLAEFPLAVLSTRSNSKVKTLEFSDSQRLKTGEVIERRWIITGADKFGLPTSTDDDVVLGLMRLSMDSGFRERKVYFTRYELLKILRWSTEGRSYSRLTKSLDRLSGVRVRASNAFFDNTLKAYQTKNFGVIDEYEINDSRKRDRRVPEARSYFVWSEVLFDSFRKGFIKKLDLDLYFSLNSAVSRRLYRYLDKHFYYKHTVEKNLMTLAFEKLGVSRNYRFVSSIKQQLEPGAEELVQIGFLNSYSFSGRGPDTMVRFVKAGEESSHPVQSLAQPAPPPQSDKLVKALASRGLAMTQARKLLAGRQTSQLAHIARIIRYFDHLVAQQDVKVSRNPAGFLYRAVESPEKFTLPAEFNKAPTMNKKRPELRVIRATAEGSKQEYDAYVEREVTKAKEQMREGELAQIYLSAVERIQSLKSVMEEGQYQRVLEGCVQEEIVRRISLPTFDAWKRLA